MAAFTGTPVKSNEYTLQTDGKVHVRDYSDLKIAYFSYTHSAGAGDGEVDLVQLPAGRVRIFPDLCRIVSTQFASNADLHLGYRAYTDEAGTAVAEDDNAFLDNGDAGGGAIDAAWTLPAGGSAVYDTQGGLRVFAKIDTGNIEDTDTIDGWVAYVHA